MSYLLSRMLLLLCELGLLGNGRLRLRLLLLLLGLWLGCLGLGGRRLGGLWCRLGGSQALAVRVGRELDLGLLDRLCPLGRLGHVRTTHCHTGGGDPSYLDAVLSLALLDRLLRRWGAVIFVCRVGHLDIFVVRDDLGLLALGRGRLGGLLPLLLHLLLLVPPENVLVEMEIVVLGSEVVSSLKVLPHLVRLALDDGFGVEIDEVRVGHPAATPPRQPEHQASGGTKLTTRWYGDT